MILVFSVILLSCCYTTATYSTGVGTSIVVYRYKKERTLTWLRKKVLALAKTLEEERVYVGEGSQSSMFVKSSKDSEVNKGQHELMSAIFAQCPSPFRCLCEICVWNDRRLPQSRLASRNFSHLLVSFNWLHLDLQKYLVVMCSMSLSTFSHKEHFTDSYF